MFGCVVAGRPLQTNLQQVDETHAVFELPSAGSINHVSVFLLGTVPFPDGYGATVHFFWPGKGFQLLGMLSNEKPSAIFRLRGTYTAQSTDTHAVFTGAASDASPSNLTAILGLSIEPLPQILQELAALPAPSAPTAPSAPSAPSSSPGSLALTRANPGADAAVLAERIVQHLFNYLSSFVGGSISAGPGSRGMGLSPDAMIPLGMVAKWYESFMGKVRNSGIGFLERQD